jgi:hypothetical protein
MATYNLAYGIDGYVNNNLNWIIYFNVLNQQQQVAESAQENNKGKERRSIQNMSKNN